MSDNKKLIETFYTAFANRDPETMASCYHDDATFSDPAFADLDAEGVRNMWRMLVSRGKDLTVTFRDVEADDTAGSAHWDATYTFSATGRKVNNAIDASFTFKDGKILSHRDVFDFWKWSRMALGPPGVLLGWSGFLRKKVQGQAMAGLAKFTTKA